MGGVLLVTVPQVDARRGTLGGFTNRFAVQSLRMESNNLNLCLSKAPNKSMTLSLTMYISSHVTTHGTSTSIATACPSRQNSSRAGTLGEVHTAIARAAATSGILNRECCRDKSSRLTVTVSSENEAISQRCEAIDGSRACKLTIAPSSCISAASRVATNPLKTRADRRGLHARRRRVLRAIHTDRKKS